jgi:hypothetical protein
VSDVQKELDALQRKLKTAQTQIKCLRSMREKYPAVFGQETSAREHIIETRGATEWREMFEQGHADERRIIAEITAKSEELQRARTQQQEMLQPISAARRPTQQQIYAEARADVDTANLERAMIELAIADGTQPLSQLPQNDAATAAGLERLKTEQAEDGKSEASVDVDMEEANEDGFEESPPFDIELE